MSVFDGIGSILASVFGDAAVVTRKATGLPTSVRGVFRLVTVEDPVADGRDLIRQVPIFQLPANAMAPLVRGDQIVPANGGGKTYIVLDANDATELAVDAMATYRLEEVIG